MKQLLKLSGLIAVITLALLEPVALAQTWPVKPVRIINPFPAGGGTDTFARPLAAKLTQSLGQSVIIENQGGAGGTVGAANAARTPPDGYTFLMGAIHHTIAESLYPKLSYNIEKDFSQAVDLAGAHPEKLKELQALFDKQAFEYGIYPLRDPGSPRNGDFAVPHSLDGFKKIKYSTAHTRMPESSVLNLKNCSYRISAEVEITSKSNHGVIACQGGNMAGWSLYLDDKARAVFHYNWFGHEHFSFSSAESLNVGKHVIEVLFSYDGGFGAGGTVSLLVDNSQAATGRIEKTVPLVFSMSGETFDIGVDTG